MNTIRARGPLRGAAVAALLAVSFGRPHGQVETRDRLPVPDIPGYRTLKADLHLHTVFSDGHVWPSVRVLEAWRDGLDVIALTDHLEYRPYAADVAAGVARAYETARPLAAELGIILLRGVEITKPASAAAPDGATAHFNALFVRDEAALHVPDLLEALEKARAQGAFVFWNHPGFRVPRAEWFPAIATAHERKLFHGMELVNGPQMYSEAFPWIDQKQLTILSNSDAHEPMPPRERAGVRPMTLLRARNASALPFRYVVREAPAWFRLEAGAIEPERESLVRARITSAAPAGPASIPLAIELTNAHPAPGHNLVVRTTLDLHVDR